MILKKSEEKLAARKMISHLTCTKILPNIENVMVSKAKKMFSYVIYTKMLPNTHKQVKCR